MFLSATFGTLVLKGVVRSPGTCDLLLAASFMVILAPRCVQPVHSLNVYGMM
jgi:hypothetical protein